MQNKYIEVKQLVGIKLCRPTDGFVIIDMDQIEAYTAAFNTDYVVNHSTPATVNDLGIHVPAEDLTFWPTSMVESFAVWLGASDPTQLPRKATDKLSVALGTFEVHIDTKEMDDPKRHLIMDTLNAPFRNTRDNAFPTMTMDVEKHLGIYGGSKEDKVEVNPPQDDPVEFAVCANIHERDNRRFTKDAIVVVVDGSGDSEVNPSEAHNVHYYYDHANRKHSQLCERGEFGPTIGEQLAKDYEAKAKLDASSVGSKHTQSFEAWAEGFDDWGDDSFVFTPNASKPLESGFGDLSTIKHRHVDFPSMYDCGKINIDKELKRISTITGSVAADAGLPVDAETLAAQMQLSVDDATDGVASRFQTLLSDMVDSVIGDEPKGIDVLSMLLNEDTGPDLVTRVQETLSGIRDHGKPSFEDVKLVLERDALYDEPIALSLSAIVSAGEEEFPEWGITYETLGSISILKFYK